MNRELFKIIFEKLKSEHTEQTCRKWSWISLSLSFRFSDLSAASMEEQKRLMNHERLYWYMWLREDMDSPVKKRVTA